MQHATSYLSLPPDFLIYPHPVSIPDLQKFKKKNPDLQRHCTTPPFLVAAALHNSHAGELVDSGVIFLPFLHGNVHVFLNKQFVHVDYLCYTSYFITC